MWNWAKWEVTIGRAVLQPALPFTGFFEPADTKFYMEFPLSEMRVPSPQQSRHRLQMIEVRGGKVLL
jgi:hypothetical protein